MIRYRKHFNHFPHSADLGECYTMAEELSALQSGLASDTSQRNTNFQCNGLDEEPEGLETLGLVMLDPMLYGEDVAGVFNHASERLGIDLETGESLTNE